MTELHTSLQLLEYFLQTSFIKALTRLHPKILVAKFFYFEVRPIPNQKDLTKWLSQEILSS